MNVSSVVLHQLGNLRCMERKKACYFIHVRLEEKIQIKVIDNIKYFLFKKLYRRQKISNLAVLMKNHFSKMVH